MNITDPNDQSLGQSRNNLGCSYKSLLFQRSMELFDVTIEYSDNGH